MAEENKPVNTEAQAQQQPDATPAATGEQAAQGKTFSQEEVNRIVSDRLARERAKAEAPAADEREAELTARENKLKCQELISADENYPKEFLTVLDTGDFDKFKQMADKLLEAFPSISPKAPRFMPQFTAPMGGKPLISSDDTIAKVFGLKR